MRHSLPPSRKGDENLSRLIGCAILIAVLAGGCIFDGAADPDDPTGPLVGQITGWEMESPRRINLTVRFINNGSEEIWATELRSRVTMRAGDYSVHARTEDARGEFATFLSPTEALPGFHEIERTLYVDFEHDARQEPVRAFAIALMMDYSTASQGWHMTQYLCDRDPHGTALPDRCPRDEWLYREGPREWPPTDRVPVGTPMKPPACTDSPEAPPTVNRCTVN